MPDSSALLQLAVSQYPIPPEYVLITKKYYQPLLLITILYLMHAKYLRHFCSYVNFNKIDLSVRKREQKDVFFRKVEI